MEIPLALQLDAFSGLLHDERVAIANLTRDPIRVGARRDIIREGAKPTAVRLMLEGWAFRYKTTPDGKRQIVGLLIPGDFCDLNVCALRQMDHSIAAMTAVKLAEITPEQMDEITIAYPRLTRALWRHELVNSSIQREWLLNVGARSAYERLGHLLLEIFFRLRAVGLVKDDTCDFPMTQNDLGDATGLTAVHINRMLQELRADGLVELERRQLRVPKLRALMDAAQFNPNYLHLNREGRHCDADD